MNSKKNNTITEPEELFGTPDYVETPDNAKRMRDVKILIDILRANEALMSESKSATNKNARR